MKALLAASMPLLLAFSLAPLAIVSADEPCSDPGSSSDECEGCPAVSEIPSSNPQSVIYDCTHEDDDSHGETVNPEAAQHIG